MHAEQKILIGNDSVVGITHYYINFFTFHRTLYVIF